MAMIPTFPFIAALRASIGGSSNSFVSLLYVCGKYHSVSTKKSYGKTSYNFSVMQCTDQFEASTSPAVRYAFDTRTTERLSWEQIKFNVVFKKVHHILYITLVKKIKITNG